MNSQNIINTVNMIIKDQDKSVSSISRKLGKSTQALNKQLNNNDMKLSTLLEIIENGLLCDIDITITDRATKKKYKI